MYTAMEQSPAAFAATLDVALRTLGAPVCSLPAPGSHPLPPEGLLTGVATAVRVSMVGQAVKQLPAAAAHPAAAAAAGLNGSSSSSSLAPSQHMPFVMSMLLSSLKCAAAFRGRFPDQALLIPATASTQRVRGMGVMIYAALSNNNWSPGLPGLPFRSVERNLRIGDYMEARVVAKEGVWTFKPGGEIIKHSSSSSGGGGGWLQWQQCVVQS